MVWTATATTASYYTLCMFPSSSDYLSFLLHARPIIPQGMKASASGRYLIITFRLLAAPVQDVSFQPSYLGFSSRRSSELQSTILHESRQDEDSQDVITSTAMATAPVAFVVVGPFGVEKATAAAGLGTNAESSAQGESWASFGDFEPQTKAAGTAGGGTAGGAAAAELSVSPLLYARSVELLSDDLLLLSELPDPGVAEDPGFTGATTTRILPIADLMAMATLKTDFVSAAAAVEETVSAAAPSSPPLFLPPAAPATTASLQWLLPGHVRNVFHSPFHCLPHQVGQQQQQQPMPQYLSSAGLGGLAGSDPFQGAKSHPNDGEALPALLFECCIGREGDVPRGYLTYR